MSHHDTQVAGSHTANDLDIVVVAHAQGFGPGQPGITRPVGDGDGHDGIFHAGTERCGKGNGQD